VYRALPIVKGELFELPKIPFVSVRLFETDSGICRSTAGLTPEVLLIVKLLTFVLNVPGPETVCWVVPAKISPLVVFPGAVKSKVKVPALDMLPRIVSINPLTRNWFAGPLLIVKLPFMVVAAESLTIRVVLEDAELLFIITLPKVRPVPITKPLAVPARSLTPSPKRKVHPVKLPEPVIAILVPAFAFGSTIVTVPPEKVTPPLPKLNILVAPGTVLVPT
jgi:hypothetical protein